MRIREACAVSFHARPGTQIEVDDLKTPGNGGCLTLGDPGHVWLNLHGDDQFFERLCQALDTYIMARHVAVSGVPATTKE